MVWLALLVGVVIGVVSGVVGIGGGVLFIPALVWLFGMDQYKAQGTSLGALLAPGGNLRLSRVLPQGQCRSSHRATAGGGIPGGWLLRELSAHSTFPSCGCGASSQSCSL